MNEIQSLRSVLLSLNMEKDARQTRLDRARKGNSKFTGSSHYDSLNIGLDIAIQIVKAHIEVVQDAEAEFQRQAEVKVKELLS